ncbi:DUF4181 domain-containing protein [Cytobacillus gottheilii]|uniref:DUF4181 domain-containing protein n=2 Tax=Cytobacillus gottheilii TaxID=859144 RepID=A0ABX8FES0_9BACI|nr:DUF4181 domain-containing protein [Cytobacillus gottheilii]
MMNYFIFFLFFSVVFFALERVLVKVFGIKRKSLSETAGKKIDQWGRGILLVVHLSVLLFILQMELNIKWYLISFFITSFGFQMVLEWVYLKKTKQHILTLIYLVISVPILYNSEIIMEQIDFIRNGF